MNVTETVRKRRGSSFYLSKDTFNGIPEAVDLNPVFESLLTERGFEVSGVIDEKHGVVDVVFLDQLREKFLRERDRVRRKELDVEQSDRKSVV